MPYCRICEVRKVPNEGDVCPNCQEAAASVQDQADVAPSAASAPETDREDAGDQGAGARYGGPSRYVRVSPDPTAQTPHVTTGRYKPGVSHRPTAYSASSANTAQSGAAHSQYGAQTTSPVVAPASQQQSAPAAASDGALSEGIVRNVIQKQDRQGKASRWFNSLFSGVAYSSEPNMLEFQVFKSWDPSNVNSGPSADKVIVYGAIATGEPLNDNTVKVYGKRLPNNIIVADNIENTTDGTFTTFDPPLKSASEVRMITVLVLAAIAAAVVALVSLFQNGFALSLTNVLTKTLMVLLGVGATIFCLKHAWNKFVNGPRSGIWGWLVTAFIMALCTLALF